MAATVITVEFGTIHHYSSLELIETLNRENVSFRDRDRKRLTRCHMASENFDAVLKITQHTSFYLTSYVTDMNYITHRRFSVHFYQQIH